MLFKKRVVSTKFDINVLIIFLIYSQVMILPPFQKQGHGAQLLQTFYNTCYSRSEVKDITGTFV